MAFSAIVDPLRVLTTGTIVMEEAASVSSLRGTRSSYITWMQLKIHFVLNPVKRR